MAQTFSPDKVMLSETLGKDISSEKFTADFIAELVQTSKTIQLGERVEMGNQLIKKVTHVDGELTDAYFVGEGEKIGVAKVGKKDYTLETKKIAVILPVTEEFLNYTWAQYFEQVKPLVVDKFNKMIDGAVFLGLHGNPFGANVQAAATEGSNDKTGALSMETLLEVEALTDKEPNAVVGHRTTRTALRSAYDNNTKSFLFDRNANTIDGLPYHELKLADGQSYPKDKVFVGDFKGIKYGIPRGTNLRFRISGDATLSKVQNSGSDSGDVHLFEQDMQAMRAVFEIAVAIPNNESFASLTIQKAEI